MRLVIIILKSIVYLKSLNINFFELYVSTLFDIKILIFVLLSNNYLIVLERVLMSRDDSFPSFLLHFAFTIKVVMKYMHDFQTRHTYRQTERSIYS